MGSGASFEDMQRPKEPSPVFGLTLNNDVSRRVLTPEVQYHLAQSELVARWGDSAAAHRGHLIRPDDRNSTLDRQHSNIALLNEPPTIGFDASTDITEGADQQGDARLESEGEDQQQDYDAEPAPLLMHEISDLSVASPPEPDERIALPANAFYDDLMWPEREMMKRGERERERP